MRFLAVLAGVLAFSTNALSEELAFVTGRPGQTESPIAVPKGYFQIETELGGYSRDKAAGVTSTETDIASTSFRYGLADGADVELVVSPYVRTHASGPGFADTGFGDVTLRARRTFFGESGEGPSFALIGFVTLPTARSGLGADKVEGGLIATGVAPLSPKASLTLTFGAADIHDGKYEGDVYGGANVSFALTEKAGVYVRRQSGSWRLRRNDRCRGNLPHGANDAVGRRRQYRRHARCRRCGRIRRLVASVLNAC